MVTEHQCYGHLCFICHPPPPAEEILKLYVEEVTRWAAQKLIGMFSWPGDSLANHAWQYYIHCAWIKEWNATNREEFMSDFLMKWLNIENITKALDGAQVEQ